MRFAPPGTAVLFCSKDTRSVAPDIRSHTQLGAALRPSPLRGRGTGIPAIITVFDLMNMPKTVSEYNLGVIQSLYNQLAAPKID